MIILHGILDGSLRTPNKSIVCCAWPVKEYYRI
jgi:hypothetical protein